VVVVSLADGLFQDRHKKSGPVTGATIKRQGREGKSGKAMQGLIPKIGTIKREKSNALEED